MATYWKSLPKKHCDFCHCWIADNRASIDFHERGKRHQENVEKKLSELRKKGQEQYQMQQTLDNDLIKMEMEALKAFKKDLANDPALAAEYKAKYAAAAAGAAAAAKKKEELLNAARKLHKQGLACTKQAATTAPSGAVSGALNVAASTAEGAASSHTAETSSEETCAAEATTECVWLEGTSPEGHTYYWNTVTGESRWDKPDDYEATPESTMYKEQDPTDGVAHNQKQKLVPPGTEDEEPEQSNEEEQKDKNEEEKDEEEEVEEDDEDDEEEDEDEERTTDIQRPAKRKISNPYGGWTTIVPDDTPPVDLQLPLLDRSLFQPVIPQAAQHQPKEKVKFKERTVSSLTSALLSSSSSPSSLGSGQASFKKRKFGGGGRSIRQRDTDT